MTSRCRPGQGGGRPINSMLLTLHNVCGWSTCHYTAHLPVATRKSPMIRRQWAPTSSHCPQHVHLVSVSTKTLRQSFFSLARATRRHALCPDDTTLWAAVASLRRTEEHLKPPSSSVATPSGAVPVAGNCIERPIRCLATLWESPSRVMTEHHPSS